MMDRRTKTSPEHLLNLPELTEQEIADKEAENGLLQFDWMFRLIEEALQKEECPLKPEAIREFQRLAVIGLEPDAGQFRTGPVSISGTSHIPPPWEEVPGHIDEMCVYVREGWAESRAIHLAAYVMWRLNWIHPFMNGNGRTSRVASYLVLCAALRMNLPGDRAVPEIIDEDKRAYYSALDAADEAWRQNVLDVSTMERVIESALTAQLSHMDDT